MSAATANERQSTEALAPVSPIASEAPAAKKRAKPRRKKKPTPQWLLSIGGAALAATVRTWMKTLDLQAVYADERANPHSTAFQGPAIFIFWHEYMLLPLYVRGPIDVAILASRHRDAEIISRAAERLGLSTIRGSGRRGGQAALLEMLRRGRNFNLAIACDGPRGPRRKMAAGAFFLASRLQIPLIGLGMGYESPWRFSSWDRFALPRPFSRARAVVTSPYYVAPDADRDLLEAHRAAFESQLLAATTEAEAWAESGEDRGDAVVVRRR
jgi:lysophospholipid acyltransferase (LPLAT)-like uncharacterized protein